MPPSPGTPWVAALRELAASLDGRPDEDLLARFTTSRDQVAFATIVHRHGALVFDVCRSVLGNQADAEDAFQATFLTLATKARTLRTPAALAGWLHGTACRVARKALRARGRRRLHETSTPARPDVPPPDPSWVEVREAIHEEVNRLPERYRAAVVLFYLAGRTQDEVGHALGLSRDGAKKRLERGRALLRTALGRRGFGPAALLAATAVTLADAPAALANVAARSCVAREDVPAAILSLVPHGVKPVSTAGLLGMVSILVATAAVAFGALGGGRPDSPALPNAPEPAKPRAGAGAPAAARPRFTVRVAKAEPCSLPARCAFLDNDRILVRPGPSHGIEVRDAKTGKRRKAVTIEGQRLWDFSLSTDRKWVAVATGPDPTTRPLPPGPEAAIAVLDTATWKARGTVGGSLRLLALAADGRTVLVSHKGRVEVWDVAQKKMLRAAPFAFKRIDAAALSPNGALAAVSGQNEIAYWKWRAGGGDKYDRLPLGRKVDGLVFSPDGKLVAEGPDSRMTVEVRDVATLQVARALTDPAQPRVPQAVAGMAFTDSGRTLVFGIRVGLMEGVTVSHRIHFWDVRSGKLTHQIDLKDGNPSSLDVSPDGKALAAMTADGGISLRVFDRSRADEAAPRR
jgi:RNA polymerase sigma factor (sigma-70 family)